MESLDAADIMYNLSKTYEDCRSYVDRGLVRHYEQDGVEIYRLRVAFKLCFQRPDNFYFEWVERPLGDPEKADYRVSALWTEGSQTYRHFFSEKQVLPCQSLELAIATATGTSKGASMTVSAYLLPSLKQKVRTMLRLKELERVEDAIVDGVDCYHLKGKTWTDSEEEFWIEKEKCLLKRVRVGIVIKPGIDESKFLAIKAIDEQKALEYRQFRESQTEARRFWNQIDYHEADIDCPIEPGDFVFAAERKSDLIPSFNVL